MIENIIKELSQRTEVAAITLGGSRARNMHDSDSDYDYYVYLYKPLEEKNRRKLYEPHMKSMEYSNHFWELEDDGYLLNGIEIEFIYRDLNDFTNLLDQLYLHKQIGHGYTTCFLDNLLNSKTIYEDKFIITKLQEKYRNLFDDTLIKKIVSYNYPILKDRIPALTNQIEKAVNRKDLHSINHRVSVFFEIYYDILFAINRVTHPGEKRLLNYALKLSIKPENLEHLVKSVFENMYNNNEKMISYIHTLADELISLLKIHRFV